MDIEQCMRNIFGALEVSSKGNRQKWQWKLLRPSIREFIWRKIGNGSSTSIWFDKWCHEGPLASRVSPRDIHRTGLTLYSHVGDVIRDGDWVWPRVLLDKYQFLNECTVLFRIIVGYAGMALNDGYGKEYFHCSELGWYSPGADKVPWVDLIWFAMGILGMLSHLVNYPTHKLQTTQEPSGSFSMMGLFECVGNLHDLFVKLLRIQHDIFSFICPFC
ncbi:hypothetical protein Tco_1323360 [Tanacetum coccineum]